VYAETFALYLLFYLAASYSIRYFGLDKLILERLGPYAMFLSLVLMFLSLIVLVWPVLRGIPWRQVRTDLGLFSGDRPFVSLIYGGLTYITALPLLASGVLITVGLLRLLRWMHVPAEAPSHPIVNVVLQGGWVTWLGIFLTATVGAGVVEEVMFR